MPVFRLAAADVLSLVLSQFDVENKYKVYNVRDAT